MASPEVRNFINAARSLNYPTTPAEETGTKGAALIEKALSFIPGSASTMHAHHLKQLEHLTKLREEAISRINQGRGNPEAAERIGLQIKDTIEKYISGKQDLANANTMKLVNDTLQKLGSKDTYDHCNQDLRKL